MSGASALVSFGFVFSAIPFLYMYRVFGEVSFAGMALLGDQPAVELLLAGWWWQQVWMVVHLPAPVCWSLATVLPSTQTPTRTYITHPPPPPPPCTVNIALMMAAGFFVNGPYALITTAVSADLGTHQSLAGNEKALATVGRDGWVGEWVDDGCTGLWWVGGWNKVHGHMLTSTRPILTCFHRYHLLAVLLALLCFSDGNHPRRGAHGPSRAPLTLLTPTLLAGDGDH